VASRFGELGDPLRSTFIIPEPNDKKELEFTPCEETVTEYISTYGDPRVFPTELGRRRYFFVCNFSPISATVTRSDGLIQPVKLLTEKPVPDLNMTKMPQAVIDWPALPFYPTGQYTLTVISSDGSLFGCNRITRGQPCKFRVDPPNQEYILPVPAAGPPGTNFLVYYVNFDPDNPLKVNLFYAENEALLPGSISISRRGSWTITMSQPLIDASGAARGWAVDPLPSNDTDLKSTYVISAENSSAYAGIWLWP
jgi:hypothetical protein